MSAPWSFNLPVALLLAACLPGAAHARASRSGGLARVDFSAEAAPLGTLLPKLAEATGLPLRTSPATRSLIVCVDVRGVEAQTLLDRVAAASGCVWRRADGELVLVPSGDVRSSTEARAKAREVALIAAAIKPAVKVDADQDQNGAYARGLGLIEAIGPDAVCGLRLGRRIVFSTRPHGAQRLLPAAAAAIVTADVANQLAAEAPPTSDDDDATRQRNAALRSPVDKIDVAIDCGQTYGGYGALLETAIISVAYDAEGRIQATDRSDLGPLIELASPEASPTSSERPLALPPSLYQLLCFLNLRDAYQGSQGPGIVISSAKLAAIVDRLRNPDRYEPLALVGELLGAEARAAGRQLVACLPDDSIGLVGTLQLGATTPSDAKAALDADTSVFVDRPDGWLVVSPRRFDDGQLDRASLTRGVKLALDPTRQSIADHAEAVADCTAGDGGRRLGETWLEFADTTDQSDIAWSWGFYRLYAALDAAQRSHLLERGSLDLDDLSSVQQRLMAVEANSSPMISRRLNETGPLYVEESGDGVQPPDDFRAEPTEAAADDWNGRGAVRCEVSRTPVVRLEGPDDGPLDQAPGASYAMEELADAVWGSIHQAAMSGPPLDTSRLRVGVRTTLKVRIYCGPESFYMFSLSGFECPAGDVVSLAGLPAKLRAAYEAEVKVMREEGADGDGEGSSESPPPR